MRVFALSDIHVDYEVNAKWIGELSAWCSWPDGFREQDIAKYFESLNIARSSLSNDTVITFSHFVCP
jgi:hypothetical protein